MKWFLIGLLAVLGLSELRAEEFSLQQAEAEEVLRFAAAADAEGGGLLDGTFEPLARLGLKAGDRLKTVKLERRVSFDPPAGSEALSIVYLRDGKSQELQAAVRGRGTPRVRSAAVRRSFEKALDRARHERPIVVYEFPGGSKPELEAQESLLVQSSDLDAALENLLVHLTKMRAVPFFREGRTVGVKLFVLDRGSIYEKLGLRSSDILRLIDDEAVGDTMAVVDLLGRLKRKGSLSLVVERSAKLLEFSYRIAG